MAKRPAIRIEIDTDVGGQFVYRFMGANHKNMIHRYNKKQSALKTVNRIIAAIKTDDYEIVDDTKKEQL